MQLRLHDTLTREVRPLSASDGQRLRLYCCGPTVYAPAHIGNLRTFLLQDLLRRVADLAGLDPYHVRNLTDVDDKTIRESQAAGTSLRAFTDPWIARFHRDAAALNMLPPQAEPRATEHIPQQIAMIERLIERGHAYPASDGSVYFRISSFPDYGKLSHLDPGQLQTQASQSGGERNLADEYDRESVSDFALWKAHKPEDGENAWESPWGPGRPGWHLECSAMSREYLGDTFDLHSGGIDLCFPHHENEIAQSEAANGTPFVRHWHHCAHLLVEGKKMSKSLGNFFTLDDIVARGYRPMAFRYVLVSAHYRQQLNFTFHGLDAAESALNKLEKAAARLGQTAGVDLGTLDWNQPPRSLEELGPFQSAWEALADDLNTAGALGATFTTLSGIDREELDPERASQALDGLRMILFALGLQLQAPGQEPTAEEAPEAIQSLAQQRWQAKQARNFAEADRLREALAEAGWKVLDSRDGYTLQKG